MTNGLRELINKKMEEEGISVTQATSELLKQIKGNGKKQLEEVRQIQDLREETGLIDDTDPIARVIDREMQIMQLEKIRGGNGGSNGGFDLDKLMGFMVLQDALDTRAHRREMRAIQLEKERKLIEGGLSPTTEDKLQNIQDEYKQELVDIKRMLEPPEPVPEPRALPAPQGMTPDEVVGFFNEAITEVATPIVETLREIQDQVDAGKRGGQPVSGDLLSQLDKEVKAYQAQQKRIEGIAETMGWKKAETSDAMGRLAARHEILADIRDGIDILKYAGDELGIGEKIKQIFGSPPAEKTIEEFDHYQNVQKMEPQTERDKLIKEKKLTRRDIKQLELATYEAIQDHQKRGEWSEEQTKEMLRMKAIICDDKAMLARLRGTKKQLDDRPKCECGEYLDDENMCPVCEGVG